MLSSGHICGTTRRKCCAPIAVVGHLAPLLAFGIGVIECFSRQNISSGGAAGQGKRAPLFGFGVSSVEGLAADDITCISIAGQNKRTANA